MSKFNRQWYEKGRTDRLAAALQAAKTNQAEILPESSYNATAHSFWRQGWNSLTKPELDEYIESQTSGKAPNRLAMSHLSHIKQRLGAST